MIQSEQPPHLLYRFVPLPNDIGDCSQLVEINEMCDSWSKFNDMRNAVAPYNAVPERPMANVEYMG